MPVCGSDLLRSHAKNERELIDRLREFKLDQYVELPQIAVMGDTSCGKSSVLSAISNVSFPSSDQLTTRCPTQLILSPAKTFSGRIRLRRYNNGNTNIYHSDDEASSKRIQHMDEMPFEIERLTKKLIDEGQYISDDTIVIELSAPDLPNLTLIDLPGLVRTVNDNEDPSLIQRVRCLVERYLTQERTIILAVVPANVDIHNTEILQLANQVDPDGRRTITVVTKMDLIDEGTEKNVHSLLKNEKKKMVHGYHAVRCRGQKELNDKVSISDGLQREEHFFKNHWYWTRLPGNLWGISTLSGKLVHLLHQNIREALPKVVQEIHEQLEETRAELNQMGPSMEDSAVRRQSFFQIVARYLKLMKEAMEGDYKTFDLLRPDEDQHVLVFDSLKEDQTMRLRALLRQEDALFQQEIQDLTGVNVAPNGNPVQTREQKRAVQLGELVHIKASHTLHRVTRIHASRNGDIQYEDQKTMDEWHGKSSYDVLPVDHVEKVKLYIRENRGEELSIFPSYRVFRNLIHQLTNQWDVPMKHLARKYVELTKNTSTLVVEKHLTPCKTSRVHTFLKQQAIEQLDQLCLIVLDILGETLYKEQNHPYTMDNTVFVRLEELKKNRVSAQLKDMQMRWGLKLNGRDEIHQFVTNTLTELKMFSQEENEAFEMQMALRSYLEIATRRFVDTIPMFLNEKLLMAFHSNMEKELLQIDDRRLEQLLSEDVHELTRRKELKERLECLEKAKKECLLMV